MEHLCECPEHGHSQPGRYGTSGYCNVSTDAGNVSVKCGDRDCSSAVCEAWELALASTEYDLEAYSTKSYYPKSFAIGSRRANAQVGQERRALRLRIT